MIKKCCLCLIILCSLFCPCFAGIHFKPDEFINILKIEDQLTREKKLTRYIDMLVDNPVNNLKTAKAQINSLLVKYNVPNTSALSYFIEGVCQAREAQLT